MNREQIEAKQLFEFVKVAAGEAFEYEDGLYISHIIINNSSLIPGLLGPTRYCKGKINGSSAYVLVPVRPAESPDAGRDGKVKQASANYVSRNKLGVSTIGMRSGFEHGAAWAFSQFPTPADPGSQVEAADPVISGAIDLIKTYQERAEIQNMALNLKLIATYHKKTK